LRRNRRSRWPEKRIITKYKARRQEWLPTRLNDEALDLAWVTDKWWRLVTGKEKRGAEITEVNRRWFELCVYTQVALDLKSGDLVIAGSDRFSDYRDQFVSDEEYRTGVNRYCEYLGVSAQGEVFVTELREWSQPVARIQNRKSSLVFASYHPAFATILKFTTTSSFTFIVPPAAE
jgi:hypothetical protein